MKRPHNFKLDAITEGQLTWLSAHHQTTATSIVEHAIATMYHKEKQIAPDPQDYDTLEAYEHALSVHQKSTRQGY